MELEKEESNRVLGSGQYRKKIRAVVEERLLGEGVTVVGPLGKLRNLLPGRRN